MVQKPIRLNYGENSMQYDNKTELKLFIHLLGWF